MKLRALLVLFAAIGAAAQQTSPPIRINQINTVFYPGQSPYSSIQSAVTKGCSLTNPRAIVDIQPGAVVSDSIGAVNTACANVYILDSRVAPPVSYSWNGSAYVANAVSISLKTDNVPNASQSELDLRVGDGLAIANNSGGIVTISLGTPFGITSFTGEQTVEIGAPITNPPFNAAYTALPDSAQITNSDGTNSPFVMTTPFTSAVIVGSFTKTTAACTNFILAAIKGGITKTSSPVQTCSVPRNFGGVGTAGALGATASGSDAVLVTATGTLNGTTLGGGLASSVVGRTFGPYSPSNQKIYLLITGCGHTSFSSGGFPFPMLSSTPVSFSNQFGATVPLCLYESQNLLSAPFSVTVVNFLLPAGGIGLAFCMRRRRLMRTHRKELNLV